MDDGSDSGMVAASTTLRGVASRFIDTGRLRAHCLVSGDPGSSPVVLIHGNLSAATFFQELMVALSGSYRCIAPDIRGFGKSEVLPIDASRGLRDPSDDLASLLDSLGISSAHLFGWSTGAGIISQFAIDRPDRCRSLTLVSPVSPFGFGATHGDDGRPSTPDFAGSGGGTVNREFVRQLALADKDSRSEYSVRNMLRTIFVHPPRVLDREDALIDAVHETSVDERTYPGDFEVSEHWPGVAPGRWGVLNALSPKYFNISAIVNISPKPPVLWIRGARDIVVSDHSLFDPATHYDRGINGKARNSFAPEPQPMIRQTRNVLEQYQRSGGFFREVVMDNVGHSPFLEAPGEFFGHLQPFLANGAGRSVSK